ncbi:MAG: glutamine-hydrolyzing carbamoyl-phosphate synthase small subunit [Acidobacteria bacterium]|nr:glutamine-hydrolyzing carbamoyl-phosphate synthase small subunit [Acidobacteriota bacterium]
MEAILALEDGRIFRGRGLGHAGRTSGEVVFNTGMTGYQEILTDPSYRGQIVTLTVPHVGNTGVNDDDPESWVPHAAGLVVRQGASVASSWRARASLDHYMKTHRIVGIEGIDTRALTRHLRSGGVLRGCIDVTGATSEEALRIARETIRLEDRDLVGEVTRLARERWIEGRTALQGDDVAAARTGYHVVALDYGVKRNILRLLVASGLDVTVVPAATSPAEILALAPDGVFLSNGPGDPASCTTIIENVRGLIGRVPIFGICLGHQLVALALGARTYKLKFGHRGTNHPVRDERTGRVAITSQNHGYAVDDQTLPASLAVTHRSLYDGTIEGLAHCEHPLFTIQFHPEAAPGPHDTWNLFDRFVSLIDASKEGQQQRRYA